MSTAEEFGFGVAVIAIGVVVGMALYALLADKLPGALNL